MPLIEIVSAITCLLFLIPMLFYVLECLFYDRSSTTKATKNFHTLMIYIICFCIGYSIPFIIRVFL